MLKMDEHRGKLSISQLIYVRTLKLWSPAVGNDQRMRLRTQAAKMSFLRRVLESTLGTPSVIGERLRVE